MKTQKIEIPKGCRASIENNVIIIEQIEPEFKMGDIVKFKHSGNIMILSEDVIAGSDIEKVGFVKLIVGSLTLYYNADGTDPILETTDSEKQLLFYALAKAGKVWNAEKMEIEDIFPKEKETYYTPSLDIDLYYPTYFSKKNELDNWRKKHKLCFRTKEEAIECTKKMLGI